ncbi:MAG: response regulator [Janthinobacterium lividum]
MTTATMLSGLRFLVVDDEMMVAMYIEDMLIDLGCAAVECAGTVAKGLAIASRNENGPDCAILDVNVAGERCFLVADALAARGIPFIFATGYGRSGVDARYADRPVLTKPFDGPGFEQVVAAALGFSPRSR